MTIVEANSPSQIKRFIDFPHKLFSGDPNYVPEIYIAQKELFSEKKNPFFKHSKVQLFLALDANGEICGRIAAIRNNNYNEYTGRKSGFFGFFDAIEDYEVARLLLDKAVEWVKAEGLTSIQGPTNFSTNDTAGLLVEGYESPPTVMMTYNPPYYVRFIEQYGFKSEMDLLSYLITQEKVNQKSMEIAGKLEERLSKRGITIRSIKMKNFKQEVRAIKEVYNKAWDKNWGFVPVTSDEFDHLAEGLKLVIRPEFTFVAEHEGKRIGFLLAIPDINQITRTIKRGRLFPFGIFKLLFGKNKVQKVRVITLGILEEYRRMGVEGIFYARLIKACFDYNIQSAEASWVLDNNQMMKQGIERINGEVYKKHRIYELDLSTTG